MMEIPELEVEINRLLAIAFATDDTVEQLEVLELMRDLLIQVINERKLDKERRRLFWEE